ncbi:MAG: RsmB/NOP family class I SAM-dependent RNA methyltransferase [Burkholderiales bacterium]|nr:MAG: RsmB/NOP family class I SAM-dependent RNA methyltransferase [Burkholderiales bacterium]
MHPQQLLEGCAELVALVMRFDHPADSIISRFFKEHRGLGQRERATLAETAYKVLRHRALYELMARSAPKGMGNVHRKLAMLAFAAPRDYLVGGILPLERAWLETCDAQMQSGEGLLDLHKHNLPEWLAMLLKPQLGDQFWPLVKTLNEPAPLDLRVNVFKGNREAAGKELTQAAIKIEVTPFSPWGLRIHGKPALNQLDVFKEGRVEVQDEGSQLLALLTGAKRGEMVADFCAGAGGKTLALGAMMKNTGRLYAFDTSQKRLDGMKPRLARSGLSNIHPVCIAHERDERIKRLAGKMDRVLVDAPCSGLGTLRRNPDLKWRQKESDVVELAVLQAKILQSASRLVKSGGRLVYATCSLLQEENEVITQAFGAANPDFMPMEVGEILTAQKIEKAETLCSSEGDAAARYLRLWPQLHSTDGFFAAVWQRR